MVADFSDGQSVADFSDGQSVADFNDGRSVADFSGGHHSCLREPAASSSHYPPWPSEASIGYSQEGEGNLRAVGAFIIYRKVGYSRPSP